MSELLGTLVLALIVGFAIYGLWRGHDVRPTEGDGRWFREPRLPRDDDFPNDNEPR